MKDQFKIQEFFSQILGGILRLHSFETNNGNDISIGDVTTFIFDVDHVDLLDALAVMEIDGLSGTGRMGGQGQIKFSRRQGVEVKNAKFFSTSASGEIKYPNLPIPDVGKALENITFTMLSVELVPADGKLQALIEILGHNPNFMNGYPHRFKIKTSGDLQETFASSLSFFR